MATVVTDDKDIMRLVEAAVTKALSKANLMPDEVLKHDEVCKLLKVHRNTVNTYIKDGMPNRKVGGEYRFSKAKVLEWIRNEDKRPNLKVVG